MTLIRWTPFEELFRLRDEMSRALDDLSRQKPGSSVRQRAWTPPVDIFETPESYVLKMELPGMKKDQIRLNIEDKTLTVSGTRSENDEGITYHCCERTRGDFQRSFNLPADVDSEKTTAELEQGVLKLTLPKRSEARPRKIEVKVK